MSIEHIKSVFECISSSADWSLQLLRITSSKRDGTRYASRQIFLEPDDKLNQFVKEMAVRYLSDDMGILWKYTGVVEYDGTTDDATIYKLSSEDPLIAGEYRRFISAIAEPDVEADTTSFTSAYLIKGSIIVGSEDTPIKMISMQNPITTLKHKFSLVHDNGKYKELDEKILSLRSMIDIICVGSTVYFLTLNGENLFNMERAYKSVCHDTVQAIEESGIVHGIDVFRTVAESGHNPRRFVSFNYDRFEALKDTRARKEMAEQFDIPLDEDGKFEASTVEAAERIVKMLCNKGMVDPFKKAPVEVSGAKPW